MHESSALSDGVGGFGVAIQTDGIVPTDIHKCSHEGVPWQFDDDLT
jgi:hypothetical protein